MRPDRIRECRIAVNHTQESLGELLGVDKNQVSRWETGKFPPSVDDLARMAQIFNVNSDYLLGNTDDPTPVGLSIGLSQVERNVIRELRNGNPLSAIKAIVETT